MTKKSFHQYPKDYVPRTPTDIPFPKTKRHWGPKARQVGKTVGRGLKATAKGTGQFLSGAREELGIPKPTVRGAGHLAGKGLRWLFTDSIQKMPYKLQVEMCRYLSNNYPEVYEDHWSKGISTSSLLHRIKAWEPTVYQETLQVCQNKIY